LSQSPKFQSLSIAKFAHFSMNAISIRLDCTWRYDAFSRIFRITSQIILTEKISIIAKATRTTWRSWWSEWVAQQQRPEWRAVIHRTERIAAPRGCVQNRQMCSRYTLGRTPII
jgi:hypothetical protein